MLRTKGRIDCPGDCLDGTLEVEVSVHPGQEKISYPNASAQPRIYPHVEDVLEWRTYDCRCDLSRLTARRAVEENEAEVLSGDR